MLVVPSLGCKIKATSKKLDNEPNKFLGINYLSAYNVCVFIKTKPIKIVK